MNYLYTNIITESENADSIKKKYLERYDYKEGDLSGEERNRKANELIDSIVNGKSECANWKIVDVHDDNNNSGMYGLLIETDQDNAIVSFRGSEGDVDGQFEKDWIYADFGLFDAVSTRQQIEAEIFKNEIRTKYDNYDHYVVTGHSLGGNLAEHFVIMSQGKFAEKIINAYSLDGPGFSNEYHEKHADQIALNGNKLIHYQWSLVGVLLHMPEGETYISVKSYGPEDYDGQLKQMFFRHDTMSLKFDSKGNVCPGEMGNFEKAISEGSKLMDDNSNDETEVILRIANHLSNLTLGEKIVYGGMAIGPIAYLAFNPVTGPVVAPLAAIVMTAYYADKYFYDGEHLTNYVIPAVTKFVLGIVELGEYVAAGVNDARKWTIEKFNEFVEWSSNALDITKKITMTEIGMWGYKNLPSWMGEKWLGFWTEAMNASVRVDPLILDIDGDGFNISSKKYGSYFDLNSDGFAERINWTNRDAILALDINGNGKIDNGREVFGDFHLLADGTNAKNGFEALAQYDTNEDGIIDEEDEIFDKLRLWTDSNSDGESVPTELKKLSDFGIKAIKLNYEVANQSTGTEALIGNVASFEYRDGTEGSIGEMWVASDLYDTIGTVITGISEEINGLPDVRGYGKLNSLHTEISLDETGIIQTLVEQFVDETDNDKRLGIVDQLLNFMCNTKDIEEESRGGFFSAKKLKVLETIMGENFMGVNGENPNSAAAPILENAYRQIVEMYCFAMIGSKISKYLDYIIVNPDENGNMKFNTYMVNSQYRDR